MLIECPWLSTSGSELHITTELTYEKKETRLPDEISDRCHEIKEMYNVQHNFKLPLTL